MDAEKISPGIPPLKGRRACRRNLMGISRKKFLFIYIYNI